jgi:predicted nuclease of predicted toxin-antitoxin system
MKLLLDQGLPRSAAALLRDAGIDAVHVGEIAMSEAEDIAIITRADQENRTVVTLDADFHSLLALNELTSPSVIRIRIEGLKADALKKLLLAVIIECTEDLQHGAAITIDPNRVRIRKLPLIHN